MKPTKDDGILLLQYIQTVQTPEMDDVYKWFMDDFKAKDYKEFKAKYPHGSAGTTNFNRLLTTFELAGVLVSHGVLNEDLFFDLTPLPFFWPRIEKIVAGMREESGPILWENAVWLAERHKVWAKEVWKPNLEWKLKRPKKSPKKR